MDDLKPGQLEKILDDFREAWNKPRPFRQRYAERWNWPEAITEVKTEKVISIDEILEGFNGL